MKECPKCHWINGHDPDKNCHPVLSVVLPVLFALVLITPFVVLGPLTLLRVIVAVVMSGGGCLVPGPPC